MSSHQIRAHSLPFPEGGTNCQASGKEHPPLVSIVVPAHNEEGNILPLFEQIRAVLGDTPLSWEVIFVDDGSTDATWQRVAELSEEERNVRALKLSRNFGHQNALFAGLRFAIGEAVVSMDADLQHPPAVLPRLIAEWRRGAKVVTTARADAVSTGPLKRLTSWGFYKLLSFLCSENIHPGMSDFCLLDRVVVKEILRLREVDLFLRGVVTWIGFPRARVPYQAGERSSGVTKYSFRRMLNFAVTGITSMSIRPLRLGILGALFAAACGLCELVYVLYVAIFLGTSLPGWASTLVVMSFFFTFLFLYLGVFGEYLGRVFENVKARPRFVVEAEAGARARRPKTVPASLGPPEQESPEIERGQGRGGGAARERHGLSGATT